MNPLKGALKKSLKNEELQCCDYLKCVMREVPQRQGKRQFEIEMETLFCQLRSWVVMTRRHTLEEPEVLRWTERRIVVGSSLYTHYYKVINMFCVSQSKVQ